MQRSPRNPSTSVAVIGSRGPVEINPRDAMGREPAHVLHGLDLSGGHFARWKDAVRAGKPLMRTWQ